jgi:hypothetical protein
LRRLTELERKVVAKNIVDHLQLGKALRERVLPSGVGAGSCPIAAFWPAPGLVDTRLS